MAAPSSVGKPEQWWLGVWEAGVASVVAAVATLRYCGGLSRSSTPKSMTGYSRSLFAVGQPQPPPELRPALREIEHIIAVRPRRCQAAHPSLRNSAQLSDP